MVQSRENFQRFQQNIDTWKGPAYLKMDKDACTFEVPPWHADRAEDPPNMITTQL